MSNNTRSVVVPNVAIPDGYVVVYNAATNTYIVESPSTVFNSVGISPNFGQQTVTGGTFVINNGTTLPTITSGAGAPTGLAVGGSLYMRTDGTTVTGLYIFEAGAWAALGTGGGGGGGNTVYSGSGAPVTFHNNGDIYFDISQTPAQGYVQELVVVSPTLDGSITGIFSTSSTFTTSAIICSSSCKLLVMMICFENSVADSVTSVTSTGLTFTRHIFVDNGGANGRSTRIEVWSAPVTTSLNQTITINLSNSTDDASVYCFGVDNVGSTVFEAGADVTGFNATGISTLTLTGVTTTNPNDLLFYAIGANQSGPPSWATAPGFTKLVDVFNSGAVQYSELQVCNQSLSTTQSSISINTGLTTAISAAALSFAIEGPAGGTTTWIAFGGTPPLDTTFARLPVSPYVGQRVVITDSTTTTFNATASGGGASTIMVWWNGTNWVVG